jgi:hypothetical protein
MTTLCKTFSAEVAARRAVAALQDAGVPARDLRLLTGARLGDIRQQPVGGYAGRFGHDGPLGIFCGAVVRRRQVWAASPAIPTSNAKARSGTSTAS